jgi:hypothetical protein
MHYHLKEIIIQAEKLEIKNQAGSLSAAGLIPVVLVFTLAIVTGGETFDSSINILSC